MKVIKPDICTSFICSPPNQYCKECSHAIWVGKGTDRNGKLWIWHFSPVHGPLFLKNDGDPIEKQPSEGHAWILFDKWIMKKWLKNT